MNRPTDAATRGAARGAHRPDRPTLPSYDVVVPVGPHHRHLAVLALDGLKAHTQARTVHVLTSPDAFSFFRKSGVGDMHLRDERSVIPGVDVESIASALERRGSPRYRAGWYFQQFLKMGACRLSEIAPYYLVWDADTILLRPLEFFAAPGRVFVTRQWEYHRPYFETYERLLGETRGVDFSFIAEHMMVQKQLMEELIHQILAGSLESGDWVWTILDAIDDDALPFSGFSEFETYGNFVNARHPDALSVRQLNSWRLASKKFGLHPSRYDLDRLAARFDYVSFEPFCCGRSYRVALQKMLSFVIYWTRVLTRSASLSVRKG